VFALLKQLHALRSDVALKQPATIGSLAIRHVDAGSCNACEHELTAVFGPHYDLARFGISVVAAPRHADVLLVTGAITTRMAGPLLAAHAAMPSPHIVAAFGDCAIGCNRLGSADELAGPAHELLPVDLVIPGCPPSPDEIAHHLCGAIALMRARN
jgi:Ni,Fe-hydrogenase III small subunit